MTELPFRLAPQTYDPAVPVGQLAEHPDNANQGDVEAIAASLDAHGWYGAVIAQKSTGYVVAGNHRYRVAVAKGAETIPAFVLDIDDTEALEILAIDNRTARLAVFDEERLVTLLQRVKDDTGSLWGTGHDEKALAVLKRRVEAAAAPDRTPADEWDDTLPEYDQPDGSAAFTIEVLFPSQDDAERFFEILGVPVPRTTYLWWPRSDGRSGYLGPVMEVADEDGDD